MKCKYCNAPVTLEDEFCPYCGALNQAARQHIADMRRFGGDYERTKRDVMDNVDQQTRSHSRIIALGFLILLNIIVISGLFMSNDIREGLEERMVEVNWRKHAKVLKEYEENEEYIALYNYYLANHLYITSKLSEYNMVENMGNNYGTLQSGFFYVRNPDANPHNEVNYQLERISKAVFTFYQQYSMKENDYYKDQFAEPHLTAIKKIEDRMLAELKTYGNLTEEDIAALPEMDSQSIMILLGKRMGIYE